jgi:hypothetical protein
MLDFGGHGHLSCIEQKAVRKKLSKLKIRTSISSKCFHLYTKARGSYKLLIIQISEMFLCSIFLDIFHNCNTCNY